MVVVVAKVLADDRDVVAVSGGVHDPVSATQRRAARQNFLDDLRDCAAAEPRHSAASADLVIDEQAETLPCGDLHRLPRSAASHREHRKRFDDKASRELREAARLPED